MHTNMTEIQVKPGQMEKAIAFCHSIVPEAKQIDGIQQLVFIVTGADTAVILAIYDSPAQAEAGVPAAEGVFSRMADMLAETYGFKEFAVGLGALKQQIANDQQTPSVTKEVERKGDMASGIALFSRTRHFSILK